jgi:hypothetical protein
MVNARDIPPAEMQEQEWFKQQPERTTAAVGEKDVEWHAWYARWWASLTGKWYCAVGQHDDSPGAGDCYLRRGHSGRHMRCDGQGKVFAIWGGLSPEETFGLAEDGRW